MTISDPTPAALSRAARILRDGDVVAFPTETVYGLGADATSDRGVTRIFEAKGRPQFNPLIVHVTTPEQAAEHAIFGDLARELSRRFWPGPLTLVLPRQVNCRVSCLATAGLETIAIRCPAHPVAQALLQAFGGPIAAPSANPSGTVSATSARHVAEGLGRSISLILDGGPSMHGLESTIIGLTGSRPTMLRSGAIPRADLEAITGRLGQADDHETAPHAPGRLRRHYATSKPIRLNARSIAGSEALLAFGPPLAGSSITMNLSESGSLPEAASNLFSMLRALDRTSADAIAVMPIPNHGLGEAINDRLDRATVRE